MSIHFLHRLPPPWLLLLVGLLDKSTAHAVLAPATSTLPYHALEVVPWPLAATPGPSGPFDLRRRQSQDTICGYLGGNAALPATCSPGSYCVLDAVHDVIGCCPDGQEICRSGVYTGCVDGNSGLQTVLNPYIFTCTGSDVCYKNSYDGGYSQWGCGTASNLATSVLATASGVTGALIRPVLSISLADDAGPATTAALESSSTMESRQPSGHDTTRTASQHSITALPESTWVEATPSDGTAAPPALKEGSRPRRDAIIGGVLGGFAGLVVLGAVAACLWRRRSQEHERRRSIAPKFISPPVPGPGTGFAAVDQDQDAYETGLAAATVGGNVRIDGDPSPYAYRGDGEPRNSYDSDTPPNTGYQYPGRHPTAYAGGGRSSHRRFKSDQIPLTTETDVYLQGLSLGRDTTREQESHQATDPNMGPLPPLTRSIMDHSRSMPRPSDHRPLWQQNRQRSGRTVGTTWM